MQPPPNLWLLIQGVSMAKPLLSLDTKQAEIGLKNQLKIARMTPQKRRRLLNRAMVRLRAIFRRLIRSRQDIHGQPFVARKRKKKKGGNRVLGGLSRLLVVTKLTDKYGVLGWSNPRTAMIANVHNDGMQLKAEKRGTSGPRQKRHGSPCTKRQAKRLHHLKYSIPKKNGKGYKRANLEYIEKNISFDQAGVLIRILKGPKKSTGWQINLPKRQFMGENRQIINGLINTLIPQIEKSPN